ncbi:hypothetical protein DXB15_07880 [Roseburia sp. OM02-15]|nr:hypothetical protein DXB15_07880 [Roseburia sp. OM02-15]
MYWYIAMEEKEWILHYMSTHVNEPIDMYNENFVLCYIGQFHPENIKWFPYGAPNVPEINQYLVQLYKDKKVKRYRHYNNCWRDGYPKWFYIYYL